MAEKLNTSFYIKQGNLLPDITGTFKDEKTGAPQSLLGAYVKFFMRNPETNQLIVDNQDAYIIGDPVNGKVGYAWQDGDTDVAGTMDAEFTAYFGLKPLSGPNRRNLKVHIADSVESDTL